MSFSDRFHEVPRASEIFTNRQDEQDSFDQSVAALQEHFALYGGGTPLGPLEPRSNVLTFYGVGGIGKSALLARLKDRAGDRANQPSHWPPAIPFDPNPTICSLEMDDFDPEDAVLSLRASVAAAGWQCPAFDLVLARYWSQRHADFSVLQAFRSRSRLRSLSSALGAGEHIQTALEDVSQTLVGTSVPGVTAFRAIAQASDATFRQWISASALRRCPGLRELIELDAEPHNLAYAFHALSWDLDNSAAKAPRAAFIFVDSMETASAASELFLNRMAWMLPNALFVVAGRNFLNWSSDDSFVEFRGLDRWPGLGRGASIEPRQHLVGYLSTADATYWLRQALGDVAAAEVVHAAVAESGGLPVHLDLIVERVRNLSARREPTVEDVLGDLGSVARRLLVDLSSPQRRALLAATLYRAFDLELVASTAGLPVSGPVLELVGRPYINSSGNELGPHKLHDVLRDVFQAATDLGDDQWLSSDWRAAAERGANLLHDRIQDGRFQWSAHGEGSVEGGG